MPEEVSKVDPFTIRSEYTGDRVYLIQEGKRFWVKNPETLDKLGFTLGQEKNVKYEELMQYPEAEALDFRENKEEKKPEISSVEIDKEARIKAILGIK